MTDLRYLIQSITWTSVIDILLVTLVFMLILLLIRGTRGVQLLRGIILIVLLVLFGGAKLPQLARNLGQAQKEFKKGLSEGDDTSDGADKA